MEYYGIIIIMLALYCENFVEYYIVACMYSKQIVELSLHYVLHKIVYAHVIEWTLPFKGAGGGMGESLSKYSDRARIY